MRAILSLTLAVTLTGPLAAQYRLEPGTLPPGTYYRDPLVNQALGLTPQQAALLAQVTNQPQVMFASDVNVLGGLTVGERVNRIQELRRVYEAAWNQVALELWYQNQLSQYQQPQWSYGPPASRFMTPNQLSGYPHPSLRFQSFPRR